MFLAQGYNAVMPVRLKPETPQSRFKYSTTALLLSIITLPSLKKVALLVYKAYVKDIWMYMYRWMDDFVLFVLMLYIQVNNISVSQDVFN